MYCYHACSHGIQFFACSFGIFQNKLLVSCYLVADVDYGNSLNAERSVASENALLMILKSILR